MKSNEIKIENILRLPPGSLEGMDRALDRVFDHLRSNDALDPDDGYEAALARSSLTHRPRWRRIAVLAAAALVVAAAVIGFKWQSRYGTLETADGRSRWIFQGATFGKAGGLLTLRDGSGVEVRAASQVVLERAADGVRVRLDEGSIIVNAAKRRQGHLYVQTKDLTVSVVGTVFVVKAEKAGSRVAVVQGEVAVREGTAEKQLLPGEHLATYASMEFPSVREEISWSGHAEEHLALLQQAPTSQSVPPPEWQTAAGGKMSFEVASIRPSNERNLGLFPLSNDETYRQAGGYFRASFQLINYIEFAYKLPRDRRESLLSQLPEWADKDYFAIEAKAPISRPTKDQMRLMIQSLLAERFKMAVRFELQDVPVFALNLVNVGKLGPQIRPHSEGPPCPTKQDESEVVVLESDPNVWPPSCGAVILAGTPGNLGLGPAKKNAVNTLLFAGRNVGLDLFLASYLGRPIVNQTELAGYFDFRLEYVPEPGSVWAKLAPGIPPEEFQGGPSYLEALRNQLGMKLESTKAWLPVLVIDHVEKPSEN